MFCDLADSTPLSGRLDPEQWRAVLRAFQTACAETIAAFGGHVARYMGDGLLVYFGYPAAQEGDAQRAVRCGLAIVVAVGRLNGRLEAEQGVSLGVRAGIHTGVVVLGEMGSGARVEHADVVGETPNIAARLQALAAPNSVVLGDTTHRLVQGFFRCEPLGAQDLKGVARPLPVYRVLGETDAAGRLDVAGTLTPLVGREQEVALLTERWRQATTGRMQVVVLSGEAGIGKSRLVRVLRERIEQEPHLRVELRCSQFHQHSALYPLIDHYQRLLGFAANDEPAARIARLEDALKGDGIALDETVPLFALMLSLPLPERYTMPALPPERLKQKTYAAAITWLRAVARQQPVLLIVEDLHWIDPSTLEFLSLTLEQTTDLPLLVLLTCRPEFVPPWPPEAHVSLLTLTRLDRGQAREVATRVAGGKALPAEVIEPIVARTDGVPLFVEELTRMVLESGLVAERGGRYELTGPLPPLAIPATLHDSLMARLDRLAAVKEIAQLGATLGREFSYELIAAVARLDETALRSALAQLVEAGLLFQRGQPPTARYVFKHALIQDAAYESLLRSRRQQLHRQVAQVLEERFPEVVDAQPEVVAQHFTAAGLGEAAVGYWQQAGTRAYARSANREAVAHLTTGLQVLRQLPDTPERAARELGLQLALVPAIMAAKGYAAPELEPTYTRVRELCRTLGDTAQVLPALWGLVVSHIVRAQYRTGLELAGQFLLLAEAQDDPGVRALGHGLLTTAQIWVGDFAAAHRHAELGASLYDPERDAAAVHIYAQDAGMTCLVYGGMAAWYLGYPDQAVEKVRQGLAHARRLSHPNTLAFALGMAGLVQLLRRNCEATEELAAEVIDLSAEQGFVNWPQYAALSFGWLLTEQGRFDEGIAKLRAGLEAKRARGAEMWNPWFRALLATACMGTGRTHDALAALGEAVREIEQTDERFYEAEVYRLRGEARGAEHEADAEWDFLHAITIARRQQAKSLELRAATSLARLWQQQGRTDEARQLLTAVYGWFTEGFDTRDLREAKALLDTLR